MNVQTVRPATTPAMHEDRETTAKIRMYNAEMAVQIANETGVQEWITAAYAKLHDAVCEFQEARADTLVR